MRTFEVQCGNNFSEWDFHLHNIILHGIHVAGECSHYSDLLKPAMRRFRRFTFDFYGGRYDTICRAEADSPYRLVDGGVLYNSSPVDLPLVRVTDSREEWGSERNWWFKAIPTLPELYDLRLNPINTCANLRFRTGYHDETRGCVFCHRAYDAPRRSEKRRIVPVEKMFGDIFQTHGGDVLSKVSKVMLVTGDLKDEPSMLSLAEEIYDSWLLPYGFRGVFSSVSTLVQSENGIRRLSDLDSTIFEFPLECFSRRRAILGERKGIEMDAVVEILARAKRHFRYVRINYLVGLDSLDAAYLGFSRLSGLGLVDDIIPNIFVPPSDTALRYRVPESFGMDYIYSMRALLECFGYRQHRISATKDLYSHFAKLQQADEYSPCLQPQP